MLPYNELFIDSGINTGWAFFDKSKKYPVTGLITINRQYRKTIENYIKFMGSSFRTLLRNFEPIRVTIEHPEFWNNSQKSKVAVESGSLLHNAANAYSYAAICYDNGVNFTLKYPREWKGQLDKEATEYRVKLILGKTFNNEHINDAVAMGLSRDKNIWQLRNIK